MLMLQIRVGGDFGGVRPIVQIGDTDQNRQEHQRHQRQSSRRGLAGPADHHAPVAAGDVLQHQPRQRPHAQADYIEIRPQIGTIELEGRDEQANQTQQCAGNADRERARAPEFEIVAQFRGDVEIEGLRRHLAPPSCPCASAGTSAGVAFWLNCSART